VLGGSLRAEGGELLLVMLLDCLHVLMMLSLLGDILLDLDLVLTTVLVVLLLYLMQKVLLHFGFGLQSLQDVQLILELVF
jgi:hypothetical protein